MENKTGKIIFAASGVLAIGATLYWVWKKFIDVDDEEEEVIALNVVHFQTTPAVEQKVEDDGSLRILYDICFYRAVSKKTMIKMYTEISESVEVVMVLI